MSQRSQLSDPCIQSSSQTSFRTQFPVVPEHTTTRGFFQERPRPKEEKKEAAAAAIEKTHVEQSGLVPEPRQQL